VTAHRLCWVQAFDPCSYDFILDSRAGSSSSSQGSSVNDRFTEADGRDGGTLLEKEVGGRRARVGRGPLRGRLIGRIASREGRVRRDGGVGGRVGEDSHDHGSVACMRRRDGRQMRRRRTSEGRFRLSKGEDESDPSPSFCWHGYDLIMM
jgi:hypothetical protein